MLSCFVLRIGVCVLKKKSVPHEMTPFAASDHSSSSEGALRLMGLEVLERKITSVVSLFVCLFPIQSQCISARVPHVLHSGLHSGLLIAATLAWLMLDLKWKWSIHRRCEAVCSLDWLSAQAKEPCWRAAALEEFAEERISLHAHHWWAKAKELWWKCNLRQFQVH